MYTSKGNTVLKMLTLVIFICLTSTGFAKGTTEQGSPITIGMWEEDRQFIKQDMDVMRDEMAVLKEAVLEINNQNANIQQMVSTELKNIKDTVQRYVSSRSISFFAHMVTGGTIYPPNGETIPFEGVELNVGGAFNTTDSIFTCPISGQYFFTFMLYSALLKDPNRTTGRLEVDNTSVSRTWCRNTDTEHTVGLQCGNSVVTQCQTGQKVRVASNDNLNQVSPGSGRYSTFSGFLVYPDIDPWQN